MKNIVITGASSGIGASLAVMYAKTMECNLFLFGRDKERLDLVAKECSLAKRVECFTIDVCDMEGMSSCLRKIDQNYPVDLVVANAGISAGTAREAESIRQVHKLVNVNILGAINTVTPLLDIMVKRKKGHIAFVSSMAGFVSLASSPTYSSSKGFIRMYGESLHSFLLDKGVNVSIICPGYIDTPLTRVNSYKMPFLMTSEKAAEIILNGLESKMAFIVFPKTMRFVIWLLNCIPFSIRSFILNKLPGKTPIDE